MSSDISHSIDHAGLEDLHLVSGRGQPGRRGLDCIAAGACGLNHRG
jgi:hypothetical protein